jgi:CheY-like chemotaxis protein/anti-sigma regulatory factor (Ser/Thr protein kinase)
VGNVKGNGSELREVYTNLIFNAVDAMPGGGTITISSTAEGTDAVVRVRDTGKGMDAATRCRIFDPFFSTKGEKGMGLGMSVVYGIIERHRGGISVESEPGEGTCFTIRIPSAPREAKQRQESTASLGERAARVLAIDDEEVILELVSDILREGGCTVTTATSGREALVQFDPGKFDLVFCDLGMREMSGWEVVSAIRARDPHVGVVLLTGWGATLSEKRVQQYGIDAVLNKPFEMERMLRTVGQILDLKESRTRVTT